MIRPEQMRVNLLRENTAVPCETVAFSWELVSDQPFVRQEAYRITIRKYGTGESILDTGFVQSSDSAGVTINQDLYRLEPDTVYLWNVAVRDTFGETGSADSIFITESSYLQGAPQTGVWHSLQPDFCLLRSSFFYPGKKVRKVLARVSACSPEPSRQYVYQLFLNGRFTCLGPARYGRDAGGKTVLYYNSVDVTDFLKIGENSICAVCYTSAGKTFFCEVRAFYTDGTTEALTGTGTTGNWMASDATELFRPDGSIGTGYYFAPAENIDAGAWQRIRWEAAAAVILPDSEAFRFRPYPAGTVKRHILPAQKIEALPAPGSLFVDFGAELVGGVGLETDAPAAAEIQIRCGEELENGAVKYQMRTGNRYEERWLLQKGGNKIENFGMKTFRYVEINNLPAKPDRIYAIAYYQDFDESASSFESDSQLLNRLYSFTKYTVKMTNQDLYVDSQSRERGAYEGDVLINMLSSYAFEKEYALARFSIEYLNTHRTWPAEYALISILMVWEDYLYTGDETLLRQSYPVLQEKLFPEEFADYRGLYGRGILQGDSMNRVLVDWPHTERDGYAYDAAAYNTVLNCMACKALYVLSRIAGEAGEPEDAKRYRRLADAMKASIIELLYMEEQGAFCDGLDSGHQPVDHFSQHATAFALYCGIYDSDEMRHSLIRFLQQQKEIRMSVYGAFYLLEGLYQAGGGDYATELLLNEDCAEGARTWAYMLQSGATLTTESWNTANKPNMTFSHPWGSAPASQIVRGIFGLRPVSPGFARFRVRLQPGPLRTAAITVPTVKGAISLAFERHNGEPEALTELHITVPPNTVCDVYTGPSEQNPVCLRSGDHRIRYAADPTHF